MTEDAVDFARIYAERAREYDRMVAAEDCDGHLLPALLAIAPALSGGADVIEVGAGTGRVTRLLVARDCRVLALDREPAMLAVARRNLAGAPRGRCRLAVADASALPVGSGRGDVAVAGWAFGHMRYEHARRWRAVVTGALAEMDRVLRPGGTILLIETLGTGVECPQPSAELAEYYAWLESAQGMRRVEIRTDYRFPDVATAAAATGFFFGEAFAGEVLRRGSPRIPECTGIWWRRRGSV